MASKPLKYQAAGLLRMSLMLDEIAQNLRSVTQSSSSPPDEADAVAAFSRAGAEEARELLLRAERLYADRRRWERVFGSDSDLLHDPALDILLYLFIAERRRSDMSVSSACYAASTPQSTGLRYIAKLEDRGLAARSDDPFDRRRQILALTERGHDLVARCLLGV